MQKYPHKYHVSASAREPSHVVLESKNLKPIFSAPPQQFGGPGNQWSPETLFVAAIADCFILTFKAIARSSKFSWEAILCRVEGVLEPSDGCVQFTEFSLSVVIDAENADEAGALRLLQKAKDACLITNSLKASVGLNAKLETPPHRK